MAGKPPEGCIETEGSRDEVFSKKGGVSCLGRGGSKDPEVLPRGGRAVRFQEIRSCPSLRVRTGRRPPAGGGGEGTLAAQRGRYLLSSSEGLIAVGSWAAGVEAASLLKARRQSDEYISLVEKKVKAPGTKMLDHLGLYGKETKFNGL